MNFFLNFDNELHFKSGIYSCIFTSLHYLYWFLWEYAMESKTSPQISFPKEDTITKSYKSFQRYSDITWAHIHTDFEYILVHWRYTHDGVGTDGDTRKFLHFVFSFWGHRMTASMCIMVLLINMSSQSIAITNNVVINIWPFIVLCMWIILWDKILRV